MTGPGGRGRPRDVPTDRPALTRETIVAAALKLALEGGGEAAATFRQVAEEAGGYQGMALYTHVPGGAEQLRALMLEHVTAPATAAAVNALAALPAPENPRDPDPGLAARALRRLLIDNWVAGHPIQPGSLAALVHRINGGTGDG